MLGDYERVWGEGGGNFGALTAGSLLAPCRTVGQRLWRIPAATLEYIQSRACLYCSRVEPAILWMKLAMIAIGGALGAMARFGTTELGIWLFGRSFPWGTVMTNLIGCFGFGVVFAILDAKTQTPEHLRMLLLTGFFGAYTTFSTFAFESVHLAEQGAPWLAAGNVGLQAVVGLLLMFAGLAVGKGLA